MKEHNPAVKFIDTTHYKRRPQKTRKFTKSALSCSGITIDDESPKKELFYKCINICHGGGKISTHELVNQQSYLKITFYLQRGDDFHACTPTTAV